LVVKSVAPGIGEQTKAPTVLTFEFAGLVVESDRRVPVRCAGAFARAVPFDDVETVFGFVRGVTIIAGRADAGATNPEVD